ncbi:MAG: hypothetical protein R8L58_06275 [Mariprofundaceae bacterium]
MILTDEQRDVLTELINIGVWHAASTLNVLIGHKVSLVVPEVKILAMDQLSEALPEQTRQSLATVSMKFHGDFDGYSSLIFPTDSASILITSLTDEAPDSDELDEMRSGTLTEVGNILLNGVMGSISNMLNTTLGYCVPEYHETSMHKLVQRNCGDADTFLLARTNFAIDNLKVEGYVIMFFRIESFHRLMKTINRELAA